MEGVVILFWIVDHVSNMASLWAAEACSMTESVNIEDVLSVWCLQNLQGSEI